MGAALLLSATLPGATPLVAQGPPVTSPPPLLAPGAAAYPGIPEVPADTGRMVPGWHDFSRYPWAGQLTMCLSAAQGALGRVWRHGELDTTELRVRDTLPMPVAVRQVAERCGVPALLPAAEQQVLRGGGADGGTALFGAAYSAALLLERDSAAAALLRAAVAHAPTRAVQLSVVAGVYGMDLQTHPLRLGLLERDAALAESLYYHSTAGDTLPPALNPTPRTAFAGLVLRARDSLFKHWKQWGDTAHARAAAERFLAANTAVAQGAWSTEPQGAFFYLMDLAVLEHGVRSKEVVDVLTRLARYATKDSTARGRVFPWLLYYGKPFVWPATPYWYSASGAPVQPPAVAGASPAAAIVPGKVTLLWNARGSDHRLLGNQFSNEAAAYYANAVGLLHKLLAKYGPQGLQLVVIEHTRGMARGIGAVDMEQEAPAIRQLYQEQFGFPAAVVVDTVRYRILPDGRRNDAHTDWEKRYIFQPVPEWRPCYSDPGVTLECYPPDAFLLDKHGRIRKFDGFGGGVNEAPLLELFIQQALKEP